jgi:hypothetical protein
MKIAYSWIIVIFLWRIWIERRLRKFVLEYFSFLPYYHDWEALRSLILDDAISEKDLSTNISLPLNFTAMKTWANERILHSKEKITEKMYTFVPILL